MNSRELAELRDAAVRVARWFDGGCQDLKEAPLALAADVRQLAHGFVALDYKLRRGGSLPEVWAPIVVGVGRLPEELPVEGEALIARLKEKGYWK